MCSRMYLYTHLCIYIPVYVCVCIYKISIFLVPYVAKPDHDTNVHHNQNQALEEKSASR